MMLTFRAVTTQDLETVAPLIHRADPFGWTMQNLQSALASGWTVTAAQAEGSIVGCAVVMQVIDEAFGNCGGSRSSGQRLRQGAFVASARGRPSPSRASDAA